MKIIAKGSAMLDIHEFARLPHRFMWGGTGKPHNADPEARLYNDCTGFCATWIENLTGSDPAADFRGTYSSAEEAHAIVDAAGGLVRFAERYVEPLGFNRVREPQTGDVGVVLAPVKGAVSKEICAIRFGPIWLALSEAGVSGRRLDIVAAWTLAGRKEI
ncbi:DUF6950 family protein [Shinella sp.]|uniref:DUF6950 family protein n=1 Tax=Shinella sp. TaxID=1870904 RepID=UPI0028AA8B6D|nr:hypothetical protein [Shinella sp.]